MRGVYADLCSSTPKTQVLLLTAERLARSKRLSEALEALHKRRLLRLFVIDEVHFLQFRVWGGQSIELPRFRV